MSDVQETTNPAEEYKRLIHLMLRARFQGDGKEEERLENIGDKVWYQMSSEEIEVCNAWLVENIHPFFNEDGNLKELPPEYSPKKEPL
mgnify:CR=1 FL=1